MEKCPRCGHWTLALNSRRGVLTCRRVSCKHEELVNVDKYLEKSNVLPRLAESLKLNGKARARVLLKAVE